MFQICLSTATATTTRAPFRTSLLQLYQFPFKLRFLLLRSLSRLRNLILHCCGETPIACVDFSGFQMLWLPTERQQRVNIACSNSCCGAGPVACLYFLMLSKCCCGDCCAGMRITRPYAFACWRTTIINSRQSGGWFV